MSRQNMKVNYLVRQIGKSYNSKLKLPKFKDLCMESTEKLLQDEWIYVTQQL